jgi:phosphoribosylanthranilate isomerase
MDMTKVKICGLRRPEDAEAVNSAGAEYAGFVFAESRRKVTHEEAADIRKKFKKGVTAVGVFVDADEDEIAELAEAGTIDMVQLHGSEDDSYIERVKKRTGCPVIKAIKLGPESSGAKAFLQKGTEIEKVPDAEVLKHKILSANDSPADYIMFDAGKGCGKTFDWDALKAVRDRITKPFFLAGGLKAENAARAVEELDPYAADVSGGVEGADGYKDKALVEEFVRRVESE